MKAKIFALDQYIRLDHRAATVVLAYSALLEKGRTDDLPGDFPKAVQLIPVVICGGRGAAAGQSPFEPGSSCLFQGA